MDVSEGAGAEDLQMNLYGAGGHYVPHHDLSGGHYKAWEVGAGSHFYWCFSVLVL